MGHGYTLNEFMHSTKHRRVIKEFIIIFQQDFATANWTRCILRTSIIMLLMLLSHIAHASNNDELPSMGDSLSGIISPEQEYILGRALLKTLRGQAPVITDPLLNDYIETLIYRVAAASELTQLDLQWVIINNDQINAFAAPGGVIGVNAGLFIYAENEDEISAVLAHELAHLSQRHFARQLDNNKRNKWTMGAGLLASLALIGAGGADSGIAALLTTQAATLQSQLAFSRQNEQEADRVGMQTLAAANYDPIAMPRFFERLKKTTDYAGDAPPDYLLTHPVTESRISDSLNRAATLPKHNSQDTLEFALMKARIKASMTQDKLENVHYFQTRLQSEQNPIQADAQRYGLSRAYLKVNEYQKAQSTLLPLLKKQPHRITYAATSAEIDMAAGDYSQAQKRLVDHLQVTPNSFPLKLYLAEVNLRLKQPQLAQTQLESLLNRHPDNSQVWRLLEEARGNQKDIVGAHQARAEVFFLANHNEQALQQLEYALKLNKNNFARGEKIKLRIHEIRQYQKQLKQLM
jgi:tetratricopeptide (TPR) repeat protein